MPRCKDATGGHETLPTLLPGRQSPGRVGPFQELRTAPERPLRSPHRAPGNSRARDPVRRGEGGRRRHLCRGGFPGDAVGGHAPARPQLAAFSLAEEVPLLSLRYTWPTKARASANINSEPRPSCRRWSRAIYEAYPDVCGLLYASSMNANRPAAALYERASRTLPRVPEFNRPLSDAALLIPLEGIASNLGYDPV